MGDHVALALKPLCALLAVPLSESGQVLGSLGVLVLGEVLVVVDVGVDLVEVARVAARLLLRLVTADGRHGWMAGRLAGWLAGLGWFRPRIRQ